MITAIKIDEENFKFYSLVQEQEENKGYLDNLSRINIFIGENNSGKSRFLREIFSTKKFKYREYPIFEELNNTFSVYKEKLLAIFEKNKQVIDSDLNHLISTIKVNYLPIESLQENIQPLNDIYTYLGNQKIDHVDYHSMNEEVLLISRECTSSIRSLLEEANSFTEERIYIPILRGLRTYDVGTNTDIYFDRTKKDYFVDVEGANYKRIFSGLNFYTICKDLNNDIKSERDKLRNFETFLSQCFFDGKKVDITANKDNNIHISIGEEERPISQLGDGIQSVIILTYPLFFNKGKHMLFFFEEPEQHLHPAYQRIFMEVLMRKEFNTFQYFFTTHSNHLLDITLDIDKVSIYTFKKTNDSMDNPTFEIENVDNENTDILRLIGVRNSSVFLSNCTIWVEGITDRIYIRKYLEVFQKTQDIKFLEDIHYSFVEYGGNNITHWSFLEDDDEEHSNILVDKLCGKLFLITDEDGAGENEDGKTKKIAKVNRFEKLEKKLGKRYYCLKATEIENMLSTDVLKEVVKSYQPKKNKGKLGFEDNFTYENYKNEKIGDFIDANIIGCTRKGGYAAPSGTIKGDKAEFAKRAVKEIKSIDNLSKEARDLTEELYDFIKGQNGNKDKAQKV